MLILNKTNLEGTIMSDLKAKNTTNLHFHEKFSMKFW